MFKRVLIATDGSETSRRAVQKGIALARSMGAEAAAVSVVDVRISAEAASFAPGAPYYNDLFEDLRKSAKACVDDVVSEGAKAGVAVRPEVVQGLPAAAVVEFARTWAADLIVMGTHGRTGLKALFLGSTAQGVVHESAVPVLLVR